MKIDVLTFCSWGIHICTLIASRTKNVYCHINSVSRWLFLESGKWERACVTLPTDWQNPGATGPMSAKKPFSQPWSDLAVVHSPVSPQFLSLFLPPPSSSPPSPKGALHQSRVTAWVSERRNPAASCLKAKPPERTEHKNPAGRGPPDQRSPRSPTRRGPPGWAASFQRFSFFF